MILTLKEKARHGSPNLPRNDRRSPLCRIVAWRPSVKLLVGSHRPSTSLRKARHGSLALPRNDRRSSTTLLRRTVVWRPAVNRLVGVIDPRPAKSFMAPRRIVSVHTDMACHWHIQPQPPRCANRDFHSRLCRGNIWNRNLCHTAK
jgi:hypothetical protein